MSSNRWLGGFGCAILALGGCSDEGLQRPNIVLILADDQDYEHFGFMGHPSVHTPTLDSLAREGVVFTQACVPVSRCRPSLASLLSGRWPHQHGMFFNEGRGALDPTNSLPNLLRDAGYTTYLAGKYWESDPAAMGFDFGANDEAFARQGQDDLFRFIRERADRKLFFLWWAPKMPHWPHDAPERYTALIDPADLEIPAYYHGDEREFREEEHGFLAMVAWFDDCVRELMEELRAADLVEDTLFVFLIDNGSATGAISKGSPFDKGLRTPLVFAWPARIAPGRRIDDLASSVDVYATLLDYAGAGIPAGTSGRSLRPAIEGRSDTGRNALYGAVYPREQALDGPRPEVNVFALWARTREWKYVLYLQRLNERTSEMFRIKSVLASNLERAPGDEDLYHLPSDPYEQTNLSGEPDREGVLRELREGVLEWWRSTGGGDLKLPRRFVK